MAGNLNSGMCSPLCSDVCAFYLPQGLTLPRPSSHSKLCIKLYSFPYKELNYHRGIFMLTGSDFHKCFILIHVQLIVHRSSVCNTYLRN